MPEIRKISLSFKICFCIFITIFIPVYWIGYGPANFLWYSDLVFALAFLATIFESRFLASMAASGGLITSTIWNFDFIFTLLAFFFGSEVTGFTGYIFNPNYPLWVRIFTLFHIATPPLLLWLIFRLGYNRKAWLFQILFSWIIIPITWFITDPSRNINLVYNYQIFEWLNFKPGLYLVLLGIWIAFFITCTHFLVQFLQKKFL